jgi:Cu2+-exporting ATPase
MSATDSCFHCGLPLSADARWSVEIEGAARAMCCPGCEAVARTIVDSGLSDYYRTRSGFAAAAGGDAPVPAELELYDAPEVRARFETEADGEGESCEGMFSVEGIRCAACVWLIERRLAALPGVERADLNVATERLAVRWQPAQCKTADILGALRAVGYVAHPFDAVRHAEQLRRAGKTMFRRLFVAGLSMMQVMMYAVPAYIATDGTMEADMEALMRWASLLLTLPAVCYSATPFFRGAWIALKNRALGMDVPVALGIAAAFGASALATFTGKGEVYFDSVTMFVFLLLCSRYLEQVARRKAAGALENLQRAQPASALRLTNYPQDLDTELVPAERLAEGDLILVRPGEAVAADGVIVEGDSALDFSLLTGESRPLRKQAGDALPGGALNATQPIVLRVTRAVQQSALSTLVRLVERAGQGKPQLAQWADKVGAWFVGALLAFALLVFVAWQIIDPARAWPIAIAVLVVSCPCALSLATPSALAAAVDRLVRQGVLVVQPHVLETLHRTTHIVFDKTGTLTRGRPALRRTQLIGREGEARCLQVAAALEAGSAHPLALALLEAAAGQDVRLQASETGHSNGNGIEGVIDGRRYRIGHAAFVAGLSGERDVRGEEDGETTPVYLGDADGWLARFELADALRPEARAVIEHFRAAGRQVILLSGDRASTAHRVAQELGIPEAHGECLPEQKLEFVQRLQRQGAVVAMIGDGVNDAAVLRAADVSFALGGGAPLAQVHADAVLLSGRLDALRQTDEAAAQTMRVIRQNLAWSLLYNALAIPAAAFGLLNPWLSGVGMSASSALVVLNALRLRRLPKRQESNGAPAPQAQAA